MRTSSIRPANHSGQTELPPILSAPVEVAIRPGATRLLTTFPFT